MSQTKEGSITKGTVRCMAHATPGGSDCESMETKVIKTVGNEHQTVIFRRRQCLKCGFYFYTREETDMTGKFGHDEIKR